MALEGREHEEKSHSTRYLVLIFFVCVATCGVFFSLGFLVGYNERGSRSTLTTETVTPPPVIPPTVNPPPDTLGSTAQNSAGGQAAANSTPQTEVLASGGSGGNPPPPVVKPPPAAPASSQTPGKAKPAPNPPPQATPASAKMGEGITLQVSAGRDRQDAQNIVSILKQKGYPVFLAPPGYARANDNLFRVLVGPFRTRADAEKARGKLSREGFKPFIRH